MNFIKKPLIILLLTTLAACNGVGVAKFGNESVLGTDALPVFNYSSTTSIGVVASSMSVGPSSHNFSSSPLVSCSISPALPAGLSISNSTCVISGTPTGVFSAISFTVTATNAVGPGTAVVSLSAAADIPLISYFGAGGGNGHLVSAMSISPSSLSGRGSAIYLCDISPGLPNGLVIDNLTCVISGTPTTTLGVTVFTVTATNSVGSSSANVTLQVTQFSPVISYSGAVGTSGVVDVPMSVTPTTLNDSGLAISSCTISPAIPAGLTIHNTNCVISGTPSATLGSTVFTVTATNSDGPTDAQVTLSIAPNTPVISFAGATGTSGNVSVAMSVTPTTLNNRGAAITNCSASPTLPSGLSINSSTCVISGTPTVALASTSFTIIATNSVGSTATNVTLVIAASLPEVSYASATGTSGSFGVVMSVTPTTLNNHGATITSCSTSPALPSALSINNSTCVISGTPSVALSSTSFTVTATNSVGSTAASVTLMISATAPALSFVGASGTSGATGIAMSVTPSTLDDHGAVISNCSISPALPSGLSINNSTCVISGSPSATLASTSFTVTATNSAGATAASVTLSIEATAGAPLISFAGAIGTSGEVGDALSVSPTTLDNNGAAITTCTSAPALPAWASINTSNCIISGTPTATLAATSYTITVTNSIGSTAASVTLSVAANTPLLSFASSTGTSGAVGVAMAVTPTTLDDRGAAISNCSTSPALPAGLSIDSSTCVISGTPTVTLTSTAFTVTATNSAGSTNSSVTLAVSGSAPNLSFAGSTGTGGVVGVAMSVTPTTLNNNGAAISSCSASPSLSAGLSINNSTCVISGTPTVVSIATIYNITATNSAGSIAASVTLTVSANSPSMSFADATGTSGSFGVAMSVTPTTLNNNGAAITNCTTIPALPAWASINTSTCVISGTPNAALASTAYSVTVTNSVGSNNASVTLSVAALVPTISYASSTGKTGAFGSLMTVTPSTLNNNGAAITNCTVTPALPAWATLNTSTCVISGTPNALLSSTAYTVTATNSAGSSTGASVTLNVPDSAPVANSIVPANFNQDVASLITLSYSDLEGHQASTCAVSSLTNITVTTACSCTAGTCTVGVKGTTYYAGAASFNYTVTANGLTSNSATASFTIDSTAFVSTWRTTTTNETVTLPLRTGFTYNATVNWGDGTANTSITAFNVGNTHVYASAGTYTITINGTFQTMYFNNGGDKIKILNIPNLGKVGWTSFENAFYGCTNLTTVNGGDTSLVTSMKWMFRSATNALPSTSGWNTANVTNMDYMFSNVSSANPNTSNWNTGNVTSMTYMFNGASTANPNTTNWDTSKVTNMSMMFYNATVANPNTSNWNTANVTNMTYMFRGASNANPNTSGWDTSKVTNMSYMFHTATSANPITTRSGNIWNTANVTNMAYMFYNATSANPDTANWNTGKVTNMANMFFGASIATPVTTTWNTALVTDMNAMFYNALVANPNTTSWNTANVTDMSYMFRNAPLANPNVASWNTANVLDMSYMFHTASSAYPDTTNWNTGKVTNMAWMFRSNPSNPNTTNWNTSKVTDMKHMFYGASNANPVTSNWNTSLVTDMSGIFYDASSATPDTSLWNTGNVTTMANMFRNATNANPDTSGWNTAKVTTMSYMFYRAPLANPITTIWNTALVTDMSYMFYDAVSANPNTGGWNTSSVTTMVNMFNGAIIANPITSGWNTANVTTMANMFDGAKSANPDTSLWNTGNVTTMSNMFYGATVANPNTSNWNTSKVTTMASMFTTTSNANPNVRNWNVSKVTTMSGMFYNAYGVVDVDTSLWVTSALTDLTNFVRGTTTARPVFTSWDFTKVTNYANFGLTGNIGNTNYSDMLLTLQSQIAFLPDNITISVNTTKYKSYATNARNALSAKGWTFNDGGLDPVP